MKLEKKQHFRFRTLAIGVGLVSLVSILGHGGAQAQSIQKVFEQQEKRLKSKRCDAPYAETMLGRAGLPSNLIDIEGINVARNIIRDVRIYDAVYMSGQLGRLEKRLASMEEQAAVWNASRRSRRAYKTNIDNFNTQKEDFERRTTFDLNTILSEHAGAKELWISNTIENLNQQEFQWEDYSKLVFLNRFWVGQGIAWCSPYIPSYYVRETGKLSGYKDYKYPPDVEATMSRENEALKRLEKGFEDAFVRIIQENPGKMEDEIKTMTTNASANRFFETHLQATSASYTAMKRTGLIQQYNDRIKEFFPSDENLIPKYKN